MVNSPAGTGTIGAQSLPLMVFAGLAVDPGPAAGLSPAVASPVADGVPSVVGNTGFSGGSGQGGGVFAWLATCGDALLKSTLGAAFGGLLSAVTDGFGFFGTGAAGIGGLPAVSGTEGGVIPPFGVLGSSLVGGEKITK